MTTLIIGICVVLVVVRLFIGSPGRPALICAIVVGAYVSIAQDLVGSGLDVAGSLTEAVQRLGGS